MLSRLLIGLLIVAAIILLINWFVKTPPKQVIRRLRRVGVGAVIALLFVLAATGRLNWLYAAVGALIPIIYRLSALLGLIPLIQRVLHLRRGAQMGGPSAGQSSAIETRFLRMALDHDSGVMNGEVLEGRFKGARLDVLSLEQLLTLLAEYRTADEQSASVLEAYIDRAHGSDWRTDTEGRGAEDSKRTAADGRMTREEAHEILGLAVGANEDEIIDAHRRLMQKLHPDRGGSTYLAAKLNQAKDLLLGK